MHLKKCRLHVGINQPKRGGLNVWNTCNNRICRFFNFYRLDDTPFVEKLDGTAEERLKILNAPFIDSVKFVNLAAESIRVTNAIKQKPKTV